MTTKPELSRKVLSAKASSKNNIPDLCFFDHCQIADSLFAALIRATDITNFLSGTVQIFSLV
jgi:hypothetical protein